MNLFLGESEDEVALRNELIRTFPGVSVENAAPGLFIAKGMPDQSASLSPVVFSRQMLPNAHLHHLASIRNWSDLLADEIIRNFPENQPWQLHVAPYYGNPVAGENRCRLIQECLQETLKARRRHLLRQWDKSAVVWTAQHSLAQLLLTSPDSGYLSLAPAPQPFNQRQLISRFVKGWVPIASDKAAPSRAFTKLVEAEARLGLKIAAAETCVDLGASPGSWSYVALQRGAKVIAVDRSPLRPDLMQHPQLTFQQGDAFKFTPAEPVDWLLCDVIAAPERSIQLVLDWSRQRLARKFVVTIKFKGTEGYEKLEILKQQLPALCQEFYLTRLCANKNEACAFGITR